MSEAERLEALWSGQFGQDYTERNPREDRSAFWYPMMRALKPQSVLEVGCNVGNNLVPIAAACPGIPVYGLDINAKALKQLPMADRIHPLFAPAREIPLLDSFVDMTLTVGVLIHQPEESLADVMDEIWRVTRKWIFCAEYADNRTVEVPYRGETGALFRRNYCQLWLDSYPVECVATGEAFDRDTWWLFRCSE